MVALKRQEQEVNQRAKGAGEEQPKLLSAPRRSAQGFVQFAPQNDVQGYVGCNCNPQQVVTETNKVLHTAAKTSATVALVDMAASTRAISVDSSRRTAAAISAAVGPLLPPVVEYPIAIPGI